MAAYTFRPGRRPDGPEFLRLVGELARFERLPPPSPAARRRLLRDAFGPHRRFRLWVARQGRSKTLTAYAIVLHTYSSFLAKPTLYLEDVYLSPAHRGTGLAQMILRRLAALALRQGCGRLEGVVLGWNQRARRFYRASGAKEMDDWILFRYDEAALRRLSRSRRAGGDS